MNHKIQILEDQKIVVATAEGEWLRDEDRAMVGELMKTIEETGFRKALLDIRALKFDLPIVQMFERAQDLREQRLQYATVSTRVAIVYAAQGEQLAKDMEFFETAARNRGLPYRVFTNLEEATAWLIRSD